MKIKYKSSISIDSATGCLVLFFEEGKVSPPKELPSPLRMEIGKVKSLLDFTGKAGQTYVMPTPSGAIARMLCVGLGKSSDWSRESLRRAAGLAGKELAKMNLEKASVLLPQGIGKYVQEGVGEVFAEGLLLGAYKFLPYKATKTKDKIPTKHLKEILILDPEALSSQAEVKSGVVRGEAICLARDCGNEPGNVMTPTALAQKAKEVGKLRGLKVKVLEKKELEKLGMGMFLGVARGSREAPKLIVMEHRPAGAKGTLLFVGKGITFDSGGISLKPGAAMDEMKFDMCGAAAVLGAMDAIGAQKPKVNIIGLIPACENLPGGESLKPGDILKSYSGKHVEILNTDAEGRLILGDALAYGIEKFQPDAVVNLATLTGACVVALGHYATGAVTNDEDFQEQLLRVAKESGDIVWPLPNFPEYEDGIRGKYADLQNVGGRDGGAITAGLFLKQFVGEVPWVHLDIAGTAWGVKNVGHIPNDGATGVGVTILLDLAASWVDSPKVQKPAKKKAVKKK